MELELRENYYENILKEALAVKEKTEPISGGLTEVQVIGIKHFISKIGLSEIEEHIVALKYSEEMTANEIADILDMSPSKVSGVLSRFKKWVRCSPYRLYILEGIIEGEEHKKAVLSLFKERENQINADSFLIDIKRLDVAYLGYLGFDINLVSKLIKEGIANVGDLLAIMQSDSVPFKMTKKEKDTVNKFITKYKLE